MRVGVIGAGAVGGTLAALLARAGHTVEVTARGDHLAAIRDGGLRVTGAWGDYTADVAAGETLGRPAELVILATKAPDAAAALDANERYLLCVPLVVVQNGLDGIASAMSAAPRSDVVGGLATFASSYQSPGHVTVTAAGRLFLGGGQAGQDVPARYAAKRLGEVLPTAIVENFAGAQWTKLVINQVNALPAITGLSAQEVVADSELRRVMTLGMRETVRVAMRSGIRFETLQGLSDRRLRAFASLPPSLGQVLPKMFASRMGSTPNPGSTLQSIRRGQPTEIDFLNGAVVRAGDRVGVPTPVNAAMVHLVHQVEDSGRFVPAEEILKSVFGR